MRNQALPGIKRLIDESPMKQRAVDYVPPVNAPKPPKKKEEKKKNPTPPPKGPTTKIYKKGGGQIELTEPN